MTQPDADTPPRREFSALTAGAFWAVFMIIFMTAFNAWQHGFTVQLLLINTVIYSIAGAAFGLIMKLIVKRRQRRTAEPSD